MSEQPQPITFGGQQPISDGRPRDERRFLLARYDCYKFPPAIFTVIKRLEIEIAWREHRAVSTP